MEKIGRLFVVALKGIVPRVETPLYSMKMTTTADDDGMNAITVDEKIEVLTELVIELVTELVTELVIGQVTGQVTRRKKGDADEKKGGDASETWVLALALALVTKKSDADVARKGACVSKREQRDARRIIEVLMMTPPLTDRIATGDEWSGVRLITEVAMRTVLTDLSEIDAAKSDDDNERARTTVQCDQTVDAGKENASESETDEEVEQGVPILTIVAVKIEIDTIYHRHHTGRNLLSLIHPPHMLALSLNLQTNHLAGEPLVIVG